MEDLRQVEQQLGTGFPDDVVQHYSATNGGIPENHWWDNGDSEFEISHFLPMQAPLPDGRSVESTHAMLVSKGLIDRQLVPFALDSGGNYYCFDRSGAVYFVATDVWSDDQTPAENRAEATTRLADSFSVFVDMLGPSPD
ncbi:MAG TPA: SMI1/KNR4 family protein [Gemmatirosa sp.]